MGWSPSSGSLSTNSCIYDDVNNPITNCYATATASVSVSGNTFTVTTPTITNHGGVTGSASVSIGGSNTLSKTISSPTNGQTVHVSLSLTVKANGLGAKNGSDIDGVTFTYKEESSSGGDEGGGEDDTNICPVCKEGTLNENGVCSSIFCPSHSSGDVEDDYNGSSTAYDLPYIDSGLIIEDNYNNTFNIKVKKYWTHSNGNEYPLLTSSESGYELDRVDVYGYMRFKYGFELNVDYDEFKHSYGCIKNPIYFDNTDEESANNFTFYFDDDGVECVQATGTLANKVNKSSKTTEIETFATAHWKYTNYNKQTPRAVAKAKIKHYVPPKWSGEEEELTLQVTSENNKFSTRKPWTVTWKNNAVGENDISPVKGYAFALHRYNQSSSSSSLEERLGERLPFNATVKNAGEILNGEVSNNIYYAEIGDLKQGAECSIEFIPAECQVNNKDDIIIFAWPYTRYGLNDEQYFYNNNLVEENENIYFIQSSIYTAKSTGIVRVKVPNAGGGTHWKEGQVYVKTSTGWKESEGIYVKTTDGWKESQ